MPPRPETALRVALPVPLPRLFDYLPPAGARPDADWVGRRVRVRFGRGEREQVGVVVELVPGADPAGLKRADACLDEAPVLRGELFDSLRWAAAYYHAPLGEVLAAALPVALRAGQPLPDTGRHGWRRTAGGDAAAAGAGRDGRPRRLLLSLAEPRDEEALEAEDADWREPMRALARRGLVERVALPGTPVPVPRAGPPLMPGQAAALAALRDGEGFRVTLLEGVTGSGKTEVYLQAIA